ncbi:hypothetical protein L6232_26780, partial [Shewanella sp. C31]|nr:hypothetical protein [Shewanella electrica]
ANMRFLPFVFLFVAVIAFATVQAQESTGLLSSFYEAAVTGNQSWFTLLLNLGQKVLNVLRSMTTPSNPSLPPGAENRLP